MATVASRTRGADPMILFPAIDLKDGQCVRLKLGEMSQATVFNDDPAAQALAFEAQGFRYLHVVDLNGAFAGKPVNAPAVEAILRAVQMPVQLGGGIRDLATVEMWLGNGIRRVILGTVAVRDPALVREACRRFPGRVAVGIDARGGKVAVEGWAETSELAAVDLARRFEDAGVAAIIYTDIDRDGVLKGLNLPATLALARRHPGAAATAVCQAGGRHHRPRSLRRPSRCQGGAGASGRNWRLIAHKDFRGETPMADRSLVRVLYQTSPSRPQLPTTVSSACAGTRY
jgi:phosphoribosylformimino-5-aminoimidazole carboxamide ribotide isomerase